MKYRSFKNQSFYEIDLGAASSIGIYCHCTVCNSQLFVICSEIK